MNVTRITVGRLYNLGSYEHVRYELSLDVPTGESPATALVAIEKILGALSPKTSTHSRDELERELRRIGEMRLCLQRGGEEELKRVHGFHIAGTPDEYIQRCQESYEKNVAAREAWEAKSKKARQLLDDLGGAANWKDAKQDWDTDDDF